MAYPPGPYTLRIDQQGEPESNVHLDLPTAPATIPQIVNYAEAQAIHQAADFTLSWNAFSPQSAGAFIELLVTDEFGKLIFKAPNSCVSRPLSPADTSVVIPANYLRAGLNYHGLLRFGSEFYLSSNDVPFMVGTGIVQRTTSFILGTSGSTGVIAPPSAPKFVSYRLVSGAFPELTLSGTPGHSYVILRANSLSGALWTQVGTVSMGGSGIAVFEDVGLRRGVPISFPAFYRAYYSP